MTVTSVGDSVGDGITDAWRAKYFGGSGNTTNSQSCARCDPDGDGKNNLVEFLTGTDPTNSASSFRVTAVAKQGNDLRITWMTGLGRTNALDRSAGNSSYSTNFAAIFTVTNTTGTVTNYLDVGAATNLTPRFYRGRLVP